MNYQKWLEQIYENVFCKTYSESYYVFLCGGAGKDCVRNAVRTILEDQGYQILYPEDLFVDAIYQDKKADLLDYENLLAANADVVCVICESPGSFAELGAFVQSEKINSRLVVAVNKRYKRKKSFIMLGPVRHLKKINEKSVVEYKTNELDVFGRDLHSSFNYIRKKWPRKHDKLSFDNLSAYIAFIPIILYFFQRMKRTDLFKELKAFLKNKSILPNNYNLLFNAAVKYLLKTRIIAIDVDSNTKEDEFLLTEAGNYKTRTVMSKSVVAYPNMLHDRIRCGIMRTQLNI